jgi:hypothetical protein
MAEPFSRGNLCRGEPGAVERAMALAPARRRFDLAAREERTSLLNA